MGTQTYYINADFRPGLIEEWVASGWLVPVEPADNNLSTIDLARAQLIFDLKATFGVNDEGIHLILDLIDQLHGVRSAMRELMEHRHR